MKHNQETRKHWHCNGNIRRSEILVCVCGRETDSRGRECGFMMRKIKKLIGINDKSLLFGIEDNSLNKLYVGTCCLKEMVDPEEAEALILQLTTPICDVCWKPEIKPHDHKDVKVYKSPIYINGKMCIKCLRNSIQYHSRSVMCKSCERLFLLK